jgi:predicted alpha/beta hydrolase family esterase
MEKYYEFIKRSKSKRILILHGYNTTIDECFYKYIGHQLSKMGHIVNIPILPNTDNPNDVEQSKSIHGKYDIIIGHSFGCVTALKYISNLNYNLESLILISGFIDNKFYKGDPDIINLKNSSDCNFDFKRIKSIVSDIYVLYPNVDTCVTRTQVEKLSKSLGVSINTFNCEEDHACGSKELNLLKFIKSIL